MKKKITIALSGNPNAGKTTAFNAITGARQHIANYPGVTVEKKYGTVFHRDYEIEVVDLPGTYSLTAYSLEEIVARDFVINERPDLVVDIIDASNLDRHLYLATQFKELGVPLILALNMVDMAETRGMKIDYERLSADFRAPVIPMVARSGKGVTELLDAVVEMVEKKPRWKAPAISYGLDIDRALDDISAIIDKSDIYDKKYPARWRALKCLEGDSQIVGLLQRDPACGPKIEEICEHITKHIMATLEEDPESIIADHRYGYIAGITKRALKRKIEFRLNASDQIDKVLTNRIVGPLFMILILYGVYSFTFWASEIPILWFEKFFNFLQDMVVLVVPEGVLRSLLISGVIDGMGGVLGFVPLILFMFFTISIMEDSGYMARVAYMLDRILRWFGLHGNSVMAMVISGGISGGCAVPGVLATRVLRDPKERIATLLVVPFMNCGAKLPVYAMLITAFFSKDKARIMFLLTLLSWAFALFAAKILRSTILKGPKTPFVMELPPYRAPTIKGLLIHSWERTWQYIKKAGTVILAFSVILWAMMTFPGLSREQVEDFERQKDARIKTFLDVSEMQGIVKSREDLNTLDRLFVFFQNGSAAPKKIGDIPEDLLETVHAAIHLKNGDESNLDKTASKYVNAGRLYLNLREQLRTIDLQRHQANLKRTIAGWVGMKLEWLTSPLGFEYRTNIALVAGFAAKEVVISTLGTAYSLGEVDPEGSESLSERLRNSPGWNPLQAFTLIVFTMLYVPCIATVASIRKESSIRWAGFSIVFNLTIAYLAAFIIRQTGLLAGIGT